jgi:hypothetical protein
VQERVDPVPELPASTLSFGLSVDLSQLEPAFIDVLNTELPLRQTDWTRVTAAGANPEVETRMQARVEAATLSVEKGALRVAATVAYWGKARAQVKTPFGKAWLTRGTDWGTERQPGRAHLELELTPQLDAALRLSAKSRLTGLRFEAPAGGPLCGRVVIEVCVSREQAAKQVHAQLERAVRASAPSLLREVDRRLVREVDVAGVVRMGLSALERPSPGFDGQPLTFEIERVSVGALAGRGKRAQVPVQLVFRPRVGGPAFATRPVLQGSTSLTPTSALTFDTQLSFAQLARVCATARPGEVVPPNAVEAVTILGASPDSDALLLELSVRRNEGSHALYAVATPSVDRSTLSLKEAQLTQPSRAAAKALRLDERDLAAFVQRRCAVDLGLLARQHLDVIEQKLAAPLILFATPRLSFRLPPTFEAPRFGADALVLRVSGAVHAATH